MEKEYVSLNGSSKTTKSSKNSKSRQKTGRSKSNVRRSALETKKLEVQGPVCVMSRSTEAVKQPVPKLSETEKEQIQKTRYSRTVYCGRSYTCSFAHSDYFCCEELRSQS